MYADFPILNHLLARSYREGLKQMDLHGLHRVGERQ